MTNGTLYKMFPQRIEEKIEETEGVEICGVIVKDDKERIHIPIAYLTLSNKNLKNEVLKSVLASVKRNLPEHHWPTQIYILDDMPLTPSGKVDYRTLEKFEQI